VLPVLHTDGDLAVVDPDTGEALPVRQSSDRALAHAAEQIAALDRDLRQARLALAAELRHRYGVGTSHAGGYEFKVVEVQSWPAGPTEQALSRLIAEGRITEADARRAMPPKPKPDATQLKALAGRLAVGDPAAAKILAGACTTSPPSLRDVRREAIDAEAA
jgi:hypothetical protein